MSGDIFERLMPSLVRYLSLESLRPYLLQKGLLTGEEYSQLLAGGWGGQAQIEWAVVRVKRRGSNAAVLFLEALEECLSAEYNAGHEELVQLMRKELQQPSPKKGMDSGQQSDAAMRVAYLQMVNQLIDGLQCDPEAFGRSVMGLRLLGVYPGPSVTDFPQLFAFLAEEGHCGPWDTSLLRSLLQSLNRSDLLVCLEGFQKDTTLSLSSSSSLTTHHTRAIQPVTTVCARLSAVVGVSLGHSVSRDSGYSHKWTLGGHIPPPHILQTALATKIIELRELDIQRVFLDTPSGCYKLFEDQSSETTQGLSDLNASCSERALFACSQHLASWERLAPPLGFSWAEMQELQHDKHNYGEQKLQLLLTWKRKLGSGATFQALVDAALASGDRQFAETVRKLAHDFV